MSRVVSDPTSVVVTGEVREGFLSRGRRTETGTDWTCTRWSKDGPETTRDLVRDLVLVLVLVRPGHRSETDSGPSESIRKSGELVLVPLV